MTWRTVVITQRAKLDLKMNHLVIRQGGLTQKVFIGEIALLIIESTAVSLTAALISELNDKKVKIIFCDEKRNPSSELISYYGSHDTSSKIKLQIDWSAKSKGIMWKKIMQEKIYHQMNHLKDNDLKEYMLLESYIDQIEDGDITNREGHAAKVYFNSLFGKSFTRTQDNKINAALNYGYGIILSIFNREIVSQGYLTQLGIFHDNQFNQFNLSSDIMEPFRIIVDRKVYEMKPKKFDIEEKHELLSILNDEVYIDNKSQTVLNGIKIYTKSVLDALNQDDVSIIKEYRNEL